MNIKIFHKALETKHDYISAYIFSIASLWLSIAGFLSVIQMWVIFPVSADVGRPEGIP